MKSISQALLLAIIGCSALAGCRTDPSVALLESEMRWLEDQYYALEDQYQLKCQELESCRLAQQAAADKRDTGSDDRDDPRPSSSRRGGNDGSAPQLEPPRVDGLPPIGSRSGASESNLLELPEPSGSQVRPSSYTTGTDVMVADTKVTRILLNRQLTGGYDRDGFPGDDGVMVVIEPRNADDQFAPIPGEVTIKLIDLRVHTPSAATFAQWKLTPQQAALKMKRSLLGRGVHLELAWPAKPPRAGEYEVQVSYAIDGEQALQAKRKIQIDPPRDASKRWTPVSDTTAEIIAPGAPQALPEPVIETPTFASPERVEEVPSLRTTPLPQNSSANGRLKWGSSR